MLESLFLQILNMSFTASFVILAVIVARLLLKKAPKIFSYALWSVVLFRLVCPFSFESAVGLLGTKAIPDNIGYMQTPQISTGIPMLNDSINAVLPAATPAASMNPMQGIVAIGAFLWLCGVAALVLYSVASLLLLKRKLQGAFCEGGNLYYAEGLSSPFVLGLFRPKIYLPANLTEDETQYILLHEQTHIRRLDHVAKLVGFAALCLHWFNPLAWVAFFLFGRDMELSCDEAVIKKLGSNVKKSYSSSLLTLATGRRILGGSPLAFGEGDTKSRIKNVLNYKKSTFWVIAVAIVAVVALAIVLVSNPAPKKGQAEIESATQALLAQDSSYTVVEESYLYGDAVLLLVSAPHPEVPEVNMSYGVFVMKKVDGVYTLVASAESEPSMSLGFAAALLKWNGLTVVFGDLGERYWDFRTDEVTQVEYTEVRVLYKGGEQSVYVTNNAPYLVVVEDDVRISDIEYYAGDTLVTSYAANYDGSFTNILERDLTPDEIAQVNEAFTALLPTGEGDPVTMTGPDGSFFLNPITHFFTSYYDVPANLDLGKFVYYMHRESYLTQADEVEVEKLRKVADWLPFENIADSPVPFGRIPFASVDGVLQTYMHVSLSDMQNIGSATYLEEYKTFYSTASDFGPGQFHCTSGKTNGAMVTLYSETAVLTLRKEDAGYFIFSHMPIV